MKNKLSSVLRVSVVCVLLFPIFNTVQAKSATQLSNAEVELAYAKIYGKYQGKRREFFRSHGKSLPKRISARVLSHRVPARYKAVQAAKRQLRKRYRWGGTSPRRGFDCSGLMQYAYKKARVNLPRTAAQQYRATKRVSMSRLQTGDLIFFHTRGRSRVRVNHVGIYMGNGQFIHAPRTGKRVSVSKLSGYWLRHAIGAGRV